jgi:hypothetical protein
VDVSSRSAVPAEVHGLTGPVVALERGRLQLGFSPTNVALSGSPASDRFEVMTAGAQGLVLAIFRLAVADYLGLVDGSDGRVRRRGMDLRRRAEAAAFMAGPHAERLAGLIGLSADAIWAEARRRDRLDVDEDPGHSHSGSDHAASRLEGSPARRPPRSAIKRSGHRSRRDGGPGIHRGASAL